MSVSKIWLQRIINFSLSPQLHFHQNTSQEHVRACACPAVALEHVVASWCRCWAPNAWMHIQIPPFIRIGASHKYFSSKAQFSDLFNGNSISTSPQMRTTLILVKCLEQCLECSRYSVNLNYYYYLPSNVLSIGKLVCGPRKLVHGSRKDGFEMGKSGKGSWKRSVPSYISGVFYTLSKRACLFLRWLCLRAQKRRFSMGRSASLKRHRSNAPWNFAVE